jgi:acyl-homoserine lactone acylase PvdQ
LRKASLLFHGARTGDQVQQLKRIAGQVPGTEKLASLSDALHELNSSYGTWKTEWGTINRFQRTAGMIRQTFGDDQPSWPVGSTTSRWGCLPAFESRPFGNTLKWYGYAGNSFIAAVEFGSRVKAKTVVTGGQSFDPNSKNFTDQAERYIQGDLKDAYFYKEDLDLHTQRSYHPGQ